MAMWAEPDPDTATSTEKLWWDFFRQAFLHIPTCLQVSSVFFKCPTPATASTTMQPPKEEEFRLKSDTGRPPLAPRWWTNCFGHPAWAFNPLNIPGLKHRLLFFWAFVWLFYLKPSLETQAVHYCHREVLLKKKSMWKTCFILGKIVRKDFDRRQTYSGSDCTYLENSREGDQA